MLSTLDIEEVYSGGDTVEDEAAIVLGVCVVFGPIVERDAGGV